MDECIKSRIENKIVEQLVRTHTTVSTAESCTGGLIAATIINVPGVSEAYMQGYITYSNDAKRDLIGVKEETLDIYGAVSPETAREMASGCAQTAGSDYSVISTGIAGPDGGTPEKPVGLVYVACYVEGEVFVKKCLFDGDRQKIRQDAAMTALTFLYERMQNGD